MWVHCSLRFPRYLLPARIGDAQRHGSPPDTSMSTLSKSLETRLFSWCHPKPCFLQPSSVHIGCSAIMLLSIQKGITDFNLPCQCEKSRRSVERRSRGALSCSNGTPTARRMDI